MADDSLILGISGLFHDSAAALVRGRDVLAAASEERFTRKKADASFPTAAVKYCLKQMPRGTKLDGVVFYENPVLKMERMFSNMFSTMSHGARTYPQMLSTLHTMNTELHDQLLGIVKDPSRVHFTAHHRSHAASAFLPSPFERAAVLVVDGVGEWSTTTLWLGEGDTLTPLREIRFPNSLGLLYSAFTQYCGFRVNSGEYKLMGLAPFGRPLHVDAIYDNLIDVKPDGSFALNHKHFRYRTDLTTIAPSFASVVGGEPLSPDAPVTPHHMNLAASIQAVTTEVVHRLARTALDLTGCDTLCLAGGVALNCVSNGELVRNLPGLRDVWVQPASGDAGGALGAALELAISSPAREKRRVTLPGLRPGAPKSPEKIGRDGMRAALLGPEYSGRSLARALKSASLKYTELDEAEMQSQLARDLEDGLIIGHFNGRMEFGPRALGNRSILADPRPQEMLQRVNLKIKFREGWRPFAPMVLAEHCAEYFSAPHDSPYMLMVSYLDDRFRSDIALEDIKAQGWCNLMDLRRFPPSSELPAITHYDHSARLQTISPEGNPRIHGIMSRFHDSTGCPIILNTSFNVRGEPIVCSPGDAVRCFLNTHLDVLVLGNLHVRRSDQDKDVVATIGKVKFSAD
jgi:carbamoyltransferase